MWFGSPFLHTINLNSWNKLSKEDQDGIIRAAQKVSNEIFGPMHEEEYQDIMNSEKKAGAKIVIWKKSDLEKWNMNSAIPTVREIWIKEAQEAGLKNAKDIMQEVQVLVETASNREKE